MRTAKQFSPAPQAVLEAYRSTHLTINNLAAALEALADQVVPEEAEPDPLKAWSTEDWNHMNITCYQREETRRQILAIAAELEAHD